MIEAHLPYVLRASDERGEPMMLVSANNKILDRGLAGGWHYRVNNQGQRTSTLPVKDDNSHPCDAWANAECVLSPSKITQLPRGKGRQYREKAFNRAKSYGMGGGRVG